jgi:hypothetical protein
MKDVELYGRVRYAVRIEGLSERAAARPLYPLARGCRAPCRIKPELEATAPAIPFWFYRVVAGAAELGGCLRRRRACNDAVRSQRWPSSLWSRARERLGGRCRPTCSGRLGGAAAAGRTMVRSPAAPFLFSGLLFADSGRRWSSGGATDDDVGFAGSGRRRW